MNFKDISDLEVRICNALDISTYRGCRNEYVEEVIKGINKEVSKLTFLLSSEKNMWRTCTSCGGSGEVRTFDHKDGWKMVDCELCCCSGKGELVDDADPTSTGDYEEISVIISEDFKVMINLEEYGEPNFIDLCLLCGANLDSVDDYVDKWHNSVDGINTKLHEYLGMSISEYKAWVNNPVNLGYILASRLCNISLEKSMEKFKNNTDIMGFISNTLREFRADKDSVECIVDKLEKFLGDHGIRFFNKLLDNYGRVSVILYKDEIPHSTHFREGMQVRSFLRELPECKDWSDLDFDNNWEFLVIMSIL
jgi:hypothetical protein